MKSLIIFPVIFMLVLAGQAARSGEIITPDPIKPKIDYCDIAIELEDIVQLPATRISYLAFDGVIPGRLYVSDMLGRIYILENGKLLPEPFIDIAAIRKDDFYSTSGESGLISFSFHPDFSKQGRPGHGRFYTLHSGPPDKATSQPVTMTFAVPDTPVNHYDVIAEWKVDPANPDRIAENTYREILRILQPYENHGTGQIAFRPGLNEDDPDYGKLYVTVGDGGTDYVSGNIIPEPLKQAQNTRSVFGKILRINPLPQAQQAYTVPADNPFFYVEGYLPEIWAYGLRNPQRFSWDIRPGGEMYIIDIGESNIEEINIGMPGANYGWSVYEGSFTINPEKMFELTQRHDFDSTRYTDPMAMFDHDEGNAIAGGFIYRGNAIAALQGKYVFGDIPSGTLFMMEADLPGNNAQTKIAKLQVYHHGKKTDLRTITNSPRVDIRFGEDAEGNIYVLSKADGMLRKIAAVK